MVFRPVPPLISVIPRTPVLGMAPVIALTSTFAFASRCKHRLAAELHPPLVVNPDELHVKLITHLCHI